MTPIRGMAVAMGCLAAFAAAGCGLGPGKGVDGVDLRVTRDFGTQQLLDTNVGDVRESDTVMRVLDRNADITTRYGGRFVQSVDGTEGGFAGGEPHDWFFFVNGMESEVGASDVDLRGGEQIWWDYRDWVATPHVPAVVGSYPEPLLSGYGGSPHPVSVECLASRKTCDTVEGSLADAGVKISADTPDDAIRVLVGPWHSIGSEPAAAQLGAGPETSGVYARFDSGTEPPKLIALDAAGQPASILPRGTGLIAATRKGAAAPVWLVTGPDGAGVAAAAAGLSEETLAGHYALALPPNGGPVSLPVSP